MSHPGIELTLISWYERCVRELRKTSVGIWSGYESTETLERNMDL